jgi:uncharacterized protein with PQ loop repeat
MENSLQQRSQEGSDEMVISYVTFMLFTMFSGLRMFSYVPQILRVARDKNGAAAISYTTWILWTGANFATALYASINLGDLYLAVVSAVYAICCTTVVVLTALKRRRTVLSARTRALPNLTRAAEGPAISAAA